MTELTASEHRRAARPEERSPVLAAVTALPRWLVPVAGAVAGLVGLLAGGPVAGFVLAVYAAAAVVLLRRRRTSQAYARDRMAAVDAVSTLAAELRAGLAVPVALAAARSGLGDGPGAAAVVARLSSAIELAESSGAPLADVLDRLDLHVRAMERVRRTAQAQAAGARASAGLLAALPVAGVGLGYLVGVDPARALLHTALGAACVTAAVVLQLAGLVWSGRLSRIEVPA